ncbi:MAG: hypothetical protein ACHQ1D_11785 [Nitrososphaerales archaeon]
MPKNITTEIQNELSKLGLYQIIGGAIGILLVLWLLYKTTDITQLVAVLIIVMSSFFCYSIFCGILCLKSKETALKFSFINQVLQIIGFSIMGYSFIYVAGIYLLIGFDLTESFKLTFGVGVSSLKISLNSDPEVTRFDINIIGILVLIWVDRLSRKIKQERSLRENTDFL